jgi:hypothetical protein
MTTNAFKEAIDPGLSPGAYPDKHVAYCLLFTYLRWPRTLSTLPINGL